MEYFDEYEIFSRRGIFSLADFINNSGRVFEIYIRWLL
jgi:hypothetical protein